jgi:hypothetical protein
MRGSEASHPLAYSEQIVTSWTNPTYLKGIHMVVEFDYTLW